MPDKKPSTVDEYIAAFPADMQKLLQQMRQTIRKVVPDAEEVIGYGIPTYKLNGNLVHFGGFKNHVGFYPAPHGLQAFADELSKYKGAKGSVQFPKDEPLPIDLIKRIVEYRVQQNMEVKPAKKAATKKAAAKPATKQEEDFRSALSAPARKALKGKNITTLKQLAKYTEAQLLELHGMGPGSIPKLRKALKAEGLDFKQG